jgi:hypothetical protein
MKSYIVVPPNKCPRLVHGSCVVGKLEVINGRTWTVETDGDTNVFLTELAGFPILGYAQSVIQDERDFMPLWKHWQALALLNDWNLCPRCGGHIPDNVHIGRDEGALSRWDNKTHICSACGSEEAMLQLQGKDISPEGPNKWIEKQE